MWGVSLLGYSQYEAIRSRSRRARGMFPSGLDRKNRRVVRRCEITTSDPTTVTESIVKVAVTQDDSHLAQIVQAPSLVSLEWCLRPVVPPVGSCEPLNPVVSTFLTEPGVYAALLSLGY